MRLGFAIACSLLAGCTALSGFAGLDKADERDAQSGSDTPSNDAPSNDAPSNDAIADDASADDVATSDSPPPDGAPPDAPSSCATGMIAGAGYCIDATEVTVTQYAKFLLAKGSDTAGQPPECAWNTSLTPVFWPQNGLEAHPVVGVDWCDAFAYCAWAGKRLCGKIGGGPAPIASFATSGVDAWYDACSKGGSRAYPYSASYAAGACQDDAVKPRATVPAGSKLTCEGGLTGLFDMSGNVDEWEDSCGATAGATDPCRLRGGNIYDSAGSSLACNADRTFARDTRNDHVGFRCCSP